MTTEEKAKAYDEVIEKINSKWHYKNKPCFIDVAEIFPELKESEDERIRKELVDFVDISILSIDERHDRWISWLEKQGEQILENSAKTFKNEQNPDDNVESKFNVGDKVLWKYDKTVVRTITDVSDYGTYWIKCPGCSSGWWSEQELEPYVNQDEQKSVIEPKFKVGDFVCDKNGEVAYIEDIKVDSYGTLRYYVRWSNGIKSDPMPCFFDKNHLWTIEDARDGDVLACGDKVTDCPFIFHNLNQERNPRSYCGLNVSGLFQKNNENGGYWCYLNEVRPATKEQRDLLFQKMKESGYEWDTEKKKLKIKDVTNGSDLSTKNKPKKNQSCKR